MRMRLNRPTIPVPRLIIGLALIFPALLLGGVERLDPQLGRWLTPIDRSGGKLSPATIQADVDTTLTILVTVHDDASMLRDVGARIVGILGKTAVVRIPLDRLKDLSNHPEVVYIESPTQLDLLLDASLPVVNVPVAREKTKTTGAGVLVGVIDSGIDWDHDAFTSLSSGETRILYLLDLSIPGPFYGGTLFTREDIEAVRNGGGQIGSRDQSGHGSHVAGIAAGNGLPSPFTYQGIAPDADLIIIKASRQIQGDQFYSDDQLLALAFIDSISQVLNRPYVVNMSLGGHMGSHDGFAPVERELDRLVGDAPGKVIVAAAGNDGNSAMHSAVNLSDGSPAQVSFQVDEYVPNAGSGNNNIQIDGWYDGNEEVSLTIQTPEGNRYGPVSTGVFRRLNTNEGQIYVWNGYYIENGTVGINPFNGDREFYIQISDENGNQPSTGEWIIELSGNRGVVDLYLVGSSMTVVFDKGMQETGMISIPGTARNAITVGAMISKNEWETLSGKQLGFGSSVPLDSLASFSSSGPTRDGRIKPEVTAPGQMITSVRSGFSDHSKPSSIFYSSQSEFPQAFLPPTEGYGLSAGTSMSAPHVTGIVALMLEQRPTLTARQVKSLLTQTATVMDESISHPNPHWGWGIPNAERALTETATQDTTGSSGFARLFPNPFDVQTTIQFQLTEAESRGKTFVHIYNVLGQRVRTLRDEPLKAGPNDAYWDGRDDSGNSLATGVYFIRIETPNREQVLKVVLTGREF